MSKILDNVGFVDRLKLNNSISKNLRFLDNMGYLDLQIPKQLYDSLKSECDMAFDGNSVYKSGLTGAGVALHRNIENESNLRELEIFIFSVLKGYKETFNIDPMSEYFNMQTESSPIFKLSEPWINYQKKNEFVPSHIHVGAFSYTIWIDIPYDSDEELKEGGNEASCFQFSYMDILGSTRVHTIRLSKKDNGRMLFFPSMLRHQVYPFYTSDKYRISISGNVLLDLKYND